MTTELLQRSFRHDRAEADRRWPRTSTTTTTQWNCITSIELGETNAMASKGIALDDTTLAECPSLIPSYWPNTHETIKTVRLFKLWNLNKEWYPEEAYSALKKYAQQNGVRYLLGTDIT